MGWHYLEKFLENSLSLLESEVGSLGQGSSDGGPFVPWKLNPIAEKCYSGDNKTMCFRCSQYGTILKPSMEDPGMERWMSSLVDFPAKPLVEPQEVKLLPLISGPKCEESLVKSNQDAFSLKTLEENQLKKPQWTLVTMDGQSESQNCPPLTWVQITFGVDIGYVHTPTTMANYSSTSMQKHPSCRVFVQVFGRPTPTNQEWLMGLPITWTGLEPLEMGRFQLWLQRHGQNYINEEKENR